MLTSRRFSCWVASGIIVLVSLLVLATIPATASHDSSPAKAVTLADPTSTPTPSPVVAAATSWSANTWVITSYQQIQTGAWGWHFTPNQNLLPGSNLSKPLNLRFTVGDEDNWTEIYQAYWVGNIDWRIGRVIENLAAYQAGRDIVVGPNTYLNPNGVDDMGALRDGYNAWSSQLRAAFYGTATSTCNIYVGDVLSKLGIDIIAGNGHYTGAGDIYLGREDSFARIEDVNLVQPGDIVTWPTPEPGVDAHVEIVISIDVSQNKFVSRGGGRSPIGALADYDITSDLHFFRVRDGSFPAPTVTGSALSGINRIHVADLLLGVNASIDRTKQEVSTAAAMPLARSTALDAPSGSIWTELIAFFINLLPTYDYDDAQIDGISTYCYRARTYFLGIPLATSNEVCLPPAQTPYPYGIQSVTTEPATYDGTRDLPALFDGITEHPNYGIINFTPGPIGVILTFAQPVTLDAFVTAIGGQTGNPSGYRWRVGADLTGSGAYETVVNEQFSDAELVNIPFPNPVTAVAFRITHERFTGDNVEHIREITPIFHTDASGSISGGVFVGSATPANAVTNAFVQACVIGGSCRVSTTNSAGQYTIDGLAAGSYIVTAFPPAGSVMRPEKISPLALSSGQVLTAPDILFQCPEPPPSGTSITSRDTTPDGIPVVYWAEPLTLSTTGCAGGSAQYTITQDGIVKRSGSLVEEPAGAYTAQIAPLQPIHGGARIKITIDCPGGSTQERNFDIYIDPSGVVRTVEGDPIEGATVTLYHADTLMGTFEVVPDGSALMSPMNRRNADVTDSNGHFGWDVLAGYYKVRAEKSGCFSPDGLQEYVDSNVLSIPPAVTDLDLRLSCPEPPPPTIGCKVAKGASQALGNGQATAITFDTQINDSTPGDDCWTPAEPGRLYARESGYYLAGGAITLKSAARSGKLVVIVRRGGGNWIQAHGAHMHTVDDSIYSVMTGMFYLNVGEYIEIVGYHTLGDGIKTYQATGCEHCVNGWLMKIGD